MLLPTMWAESRLERVEQGGRSPGRRRRGRRLPNSGLSESPNPGRSTAIARWDGASASIVGKNDALVAPRPCSMMTGSPTPASIVDSPPAAVSTWRIRSLPSPWGSAVAARKPTPRCRSRRIFSRPRRKASIPPRTSSAISFQVSASALSTASGVPSGGIQTRRAVFEHHVVAFPAVLHPDPDRAPADVEHGRVETVDQSLERGARTVSACSLSRSWIAVTVPDACFPGMRPEPSVQGARSPSRQVFSTELVDLQRGPKYT